MIPSDMAVRDRLHTELDTTFFVEAGAGTGKTNELVQRIAELIASGRLIMAELAAITFTDAAAAELRDRVRLKLEQAAAEPSRSDEQRSRCATAAQEIDLAAIQTIHSFAGSLLRTYPIEAGLPPGFTVWSELEQGIAFKERFRRWLYEEAPADVECASTLSLALQLGLSPGNLEAIAAGLQNHHDVLRPESQWTTAVPNAVEAAVGVGRSLAALQPMVDLAHDPDRDPLALDIQIVQPIARRLREAGSKEAALVALKRYQELKLGSRGRQGDWSADALGNPVARIKSVLKCKRQLAGDIVDAHRSALLGELLGHLRDLTLGFAAERRALGVAMFHDLLTWSRDLLRDNAEVRRRAHARFKAILIDEFQDTDPLQLEIAWFLGADPAQAEEHDWRKLRLVPGRLFLVGDPKQSIYRFRRADIGIYEDVLAGVGDSGQVVALTQNFRSVAPVLHWVNHHLSLVMQGSPGMQPPYTELRAQSESEGAAVCHGGVHTIGGQVDGKAPDRWEAEAQAMARLARRIVAEGWLVTRANGATPEPAQYGDICVLLPTRGNLRRLERQFQLEDVPYRMESGSLVLNTPEVRDLLSCLRAIEDPSDQVALVAALRSPAYACSDADLLEWVEAGGRLDYEYPRASAASGEGNCVEGSPVGHALASLRDFHVVRHSRSSAATIEAFIADRMLAVQAFAQARPREAWRRLRYVAGQARRLAAAGHPSLRAALDWLEGLQRETFYDAESAGPEGDENAVRFMTVHAAKGLEFPIVLLTGLGAVRRRPNGPRFACDHRAGRLELEASDFQTSGFDAARDQGLDDAEQVRLLYVAATRARDHLVLSLFHTKHELQSPAGRILLHLVEAPHLCRPLAASVSPTESLTPPLAEEGTSVSTEQHAAKERAWMASRAALIAGLAGERRFTATSLARDAHGPSLAEDEADPEPELEETPPDGDASEPVHLFPAGKGSTALGLAVHSVLQTVDLASLEGLPALSAAVARERGIPGSGERVEALVRSVAGSDALRRAVAAPRMWREAPVGVTQGGALLEGFIDLLVEHPDGTLGIIDYKTDHITAADVAQRMGHYRIQGGAYALAVERATGRSVSSVEFIFAALGQTVALGREQVAGLVREVAGRLG